MENYSWADFIIFIFVALVIYYCIVFFLYYYPYIGTKKPDKAIKENSNNNVQSSETFLEDNPFVESFDIEKAVIVKEPPIEDNTDIQVQEDSENINNIDNSPIDTNQLEKNINNSNNSNNFNIFDKDISSVDNSSSLNAVFDTLTTVVQEDTSVLEDTDSSIDLTDILPKSQDLDYIDMEITDYYDDDNEVEIVNELDAYVDSNSNQANFLLNKSINVITTDAEEDTIKNETNNNENIPSIKDNEGLFDFNN